MRKVMRCDICGKETECGCYQFGKSDFTPEPMVSANTDTALSARRIDLGVCDDCGAEKGKPSKAWATLIISGVLEWASLAVAINEIENSGRGLSTLGGLMLALFVLSFFVVWITGSLLVEKGEYSKGKKTGLYVLQIFPIGWLVLLLCKKRIDRNCRAISALRPLAKQHFLDEDEEYKRVDELIEKGEVTDEATLKEHQEHKREQERAQAEAEERKAQVAENERKGSIRGSLIGMAITVFLLLQGCSVYGNHSGYMLLFNSIKLSETEFALVIGAFVVFDVVSLIVALRRRNR